MRATRRPIRVLLAPLGVCAMVATGVVPIADRAVAAEVRTLEAVGTIPVDPVGRREAAPREAAIQRALREAVERVARGILADRAPEPLDPPEVEPDGDTADLEPADPSGELEPEPEPGDSADDEESEPEPVDLVAVLGTKMLPYTARFKVLEDRGRRPALFSDDPNVSEEYMVVVEVQVDVDRVLERLVDKGLVPAGTAELAAGEIRLEIQGLDLYPGYLALRELLLGPLGVIAVAPIEMSRSRAVLGLATQSTAEELLHQLEEAAAPEFQFTPLETGEREIRMALRWSPRTESEQEAEALDDPSRDSRGDDAEGRYESPAEVPLSRVRN